MNDEQQQLLFKISANQDRIVQSLEELRTDFKQHVEADATNFSATRLLIYGERDKAEKRVDALEAERDFAKGAGKTVLLFLGGVIMFVGFVVTAFFKGWIVFKIR